MIAILSGTIGRSITGGQAWASLQYLLGLRDLGYRVIYLEDCGHWSSVYDWDAEASTADLDYPADFINECLSPFGLEEWIYRAGDESRGMPEEAFIEACSEADLFILRAVPLFLWRPEYDLPYRRVFIDVDPGFTQFRMASGAREDLVETVGRVDRAYSYGLNIGRPRCTVPTAGVDWVHTYPPVFLEVWPATPSESEAPFTSLVRWKGMEDLTLGGLDCGQRNREFPKFLDIPKRVSARFKLAAIGQPSELLEAHGWKVVEGSAVSRTVGDFQSFIQASLAEFGVAKHCYVEHGTGWVSDRTVCYLASGKPVLVQDTDTGIPAEGDGGFLVFRTLDEAAEGAVRLLADYPSHASAARRLAEQVFDSRLVLNDFVGALG